MTVLACIGHWYTSFIYAAPVILMGGGLGFMSMREKMRKRRRESPERAAATPRERVGSVA